MQSLLFIKFIKKSGAGKEQGSKNDRKGSYHMLWFFTGFAFR